METAEGQCWPAACLSGPHRPLHHFLKKKFKVSKWPAPEVNLTSESCFSDKMSWLENLNHSDFISVRKVTLNMCVIQMQPTRRGSIV